MDTYFYLFVERGHLLCIHIQMGYTVFPAHMAFLSIRIQEHTAQIWRERRKWGVSHMTQGQRTLVDRRPYMWDH